MIRNRYVASILAGILAMATSGVALADGALEMLREVPFSEDANPREAVRTQCQLQTKLPHFIQAYSKELGLRLVDELESKSGDRQLRVTITDVDQRGNWFVGRQAAVEAKGELLQDGKVIGSFRSARSTMGGFVGGYKGTCSFFGRCAKALGKDVAGWLKNPSMNARLGEL